MTNLPAAVADYLGIRRRLGFALTRHGVLLPEFVAYLAAAAVAPAQVLRRHPLHQCCDGLVDAWAIEPVR